jgi:adenosylcobyric acid synthase
MIEERVKKPCIGVVPYLRSLMLEEEDSLGLPATTQAQWTQDTFSNKTSNRPLRVAVIALPSFSNFTDFDSLRAEPSASVLFCRTADAIAQADVVILPGSKQTVDDLLWMRDQGLDIAVQLFARMGLVVGICGGMQMLGEAITDPLGMEQEGSISGLGLLPIRTIMQANKVTRNVRGTMAARTLFGQPVADSRVSGYEIHIGRTIYQAGAEHFAVLAEGSRSSDTHSDGCVSADTRVFGTYLHGLFNDDSFRHQFLRAARAFHKLAAPDELQQWKQLREESLNRLAREVEKALDMETIFGWTRLPFKGINSLEEASDHLRQEGAV